MSAKQREAYQEQQRFRVANQAQHPNQAMAFPEPQPAPAPSGADSSELLSPTDTSAGRSVTVHTDAGVAPHEEEEPTYGQEMPPT
jgi:hypothetical protein